jgi:hypothetical protein
MNPVIYRRLYQNSHFIAVDQLDELFQAPDVDMDCYKITDQRIIGTIGVLTCFAVCSQGKRKDGSDVLALAHVCINVIQNVVGILKDALEKEGCDRSRVVTYIIGGKLIFEGEETSSIDQEKETLQIADIEGIAGARFNIIQNDDDALEVLFTPDHVYYSTHRLFNPIDDQPGIEIDEDEYLRSKQQ